MNGESGRHLGGVGHGSICWSSPRRGQPCRPSIRLASSWGLGPACPYRTAPGTRRRTWQCRLLKWHRRREPDGRQPPPVLAQVAPLTGSGSRDACRM
ncbi:hypothetical protein BCR44DRAFT_1436387, partial [Catenaria anguillulae PL171]